MKRRPFLLTGALAGLAPLRTAWTQPRPRQRAAVVIGVDKAGDVVALYPLDAANFPVTPSIENKNDVDNYTDNRHGIAAYLEDRAVAQRILSGLVS